MPVWFNTLAGIAAPPGQINPLAQSPQKFINSERSGWRTRAEPFGGRLGIVTQTNPQILIQKTLAGLFTQQFSRNKTRRKRFRAGSRAARAAGRAGSAFALCEVRV